MSEPWPSGPRADARTVDRVFERRLEQGALGAVFVGRHAGSGAPPPIESRDRELLERSLRREEVWSGYGLGDLDDAPFLRTRWFLSDAGATASALLYDWGARDGLACPPCELPALRESVVLIPYGDAGAVVPLLAALPLPATFDAHALVEHVPALRAVIDDPSFASLVPHRRLALRSDDLRPAPAVAGLELRALGPEDLPAARARYDADYRGTWFDPERVTTGRYLGAWSGPELVAIAGTHIVSRSRRVAALGDVVTATAWRGRGVAAWLTGALVADLRRAVDLFVLNVESANTPGVRAYRRIGFGARPGHDVAYVEGHRLRRR